MARKSADLAFRREIVNHLPLRVKGHVPVPLPGFPLSEKTPDSKQGHRQPPSHLNWMMILFLQKYLL
jgi:hypothetical protein